MKNAHPETPNMREPQYWSEEERNAVLGILEEHFPLECDVVGPTVLREVVRGRQFKDVPYGHHMNFTEVITTLSAASALVHMCILAASWFRNRKPLQRDQEPPLLLLREIVLLKTHTDLRIEQLLSNNQNLVERILSDLLEQTLTLVEGAHDK